MKALKEIRESGLEGEYKAICESGKEYPAIYTNEYGGVMFYTIPTHEKIIGYIQK